jgi:hypothetical protein
MVHQPTAEIDRCGKRATVLVAIGLREASVPEGMVAMHGICLSGGGWRFMWAGCILGSPFTNRALTICRIVKIFELASSLKVTPLSSSALGLVFRPTLPDTQRHYGWPKLRGDDGLETPAGLYHGDR